MKFSILKVGDWGLGVFGAIWGQNPKKFKPRQILYLNEALASVKLLLPLEKSFPRSLKP